MLVYNIRKEKFANALKASGYANRWNKSEEFIIYTGSSRALSTLELVVHRAGIPTDNSYKVMVIRLDIEESDILEVKQEQLPSNWQSIEAYPQLQKLGSHWYHSKEFLILKVPSAIIPKEFNFLINTKHPTFETKVKIEIIEDYSFDKRLF